MTDSSNRRRALAGAALLALAAFAAIASFQYRNRFADDLEPVYFARGIQLSQRDANELERHLKSHPDSFSDRIELLAYYSFKSVGGRGLTPDQQVNRREHILWIIRRKPSSSFAGDSAASFGNDGLDPEGQRQATALWLAQVQANPNDVRILYNAGRFVAWSDDWQQSQELLEKAYAINPKDRDVASYLASLYWRDARHCSNVEQAKSMAAKSLQVYEQALNNEPGTLDRFYDLPEAAQAAFEAGEYGRAASLAKEGLVLAERTPYRENNSDAVHYGNIVLGRIALRQGDVSSASQYLLRAGSIEGNPHLDTFGPNMMLANELVERGERKAVLSYFNLCAKFWRDGEGKLGQWRSAVLAGGHPDFGANLRY
jgi:tetratricopeptide (TPR) repeat protein